MSQHTYLTMKEAASCCAYSPDYLSLRARQGKLKAVKKNGKWHTTREWLEEYIRHADTWKQQMATASEGSGVSEDTTAGEGKPPVSLPTLPFQRPITLPNPSMRTLVYTAVTTRYYLLRHRLRQIVRRVAWVRSDVGGDADRKRVAPRFSISVADMREGVLALGEDIVKVGAAASLALLAGAGMATTGHYADDVGRYTAKGALTVVNEGSEATSRFAQNVREGAAIVAQPGIHVAGEGTRMINEGLAFIGSLAADQQAGSMLARASADIGTPVRDAGFAMVQTFRDAGTGAALASDKITGMIERNTAALAYMADGEVWKDTAGTFAAYGDFLGDQGNRQLAVLTDSTHRLAAETKRTVEGITTFASRFDQTRDAVSAVAGTLRAVPDGAGELIDALFQRAQAQFR